MTTKEQLLSTTAVREPESSRRTGIIRQRPMHAHKYVPMPEPYESILNEMIARVGWIMPVWGIGATAPWRE